MTEAFSSIARLPVRAQARKVADELAPHVSVQIIRSRSIMSDRHSGHSLGQEIVEPICKGILAARGLAPAGKEDLPN